jgi:hypothetical protein
MKHKDGSKKPLYNGQIAVDDKEQVIVAADLVDEQMDCYYCPAGFMLPFTRIQKRDDEPDLKLYVCNNCSICIMKNACTKAKNRTISRDPRIHLLEDMR